MYYDKTAEFSYLISRSLHFYIEDKDYLNFMGSCSHENREQSSNLNGRASFLQQKLFLISCSSRQINEVTIGVLKSPKRPDINT